MISSWFFMGFCFAPTFYVVCVTGVSFCCFGSAFSQKSNCLVWVCLSTFWCFILSFLDLSSVFERINYPVR